MSHLPLDFNPQRRKDRPFNKTETYPAILYITLDCALGGGVYRSGIDPALRRLFGEARAFVTPYAATGADEYFAESVRAYVEANDAHSFWPRATRARLARIDPRMHAYLTQLFENELAA